MNLFQTEYFLTFDANQLPITVLVGTIFLVTLIFLGWKLALAFLAGSLVGGTRIGKDLPYTHKWVFYRK